MHNRLKGLSAKDVIKVLRHFGFQFDRQRGSHQQWKRKGDPGSLRVTVDPNLRSFDIGTLGSIIQQSGKSEAEWVKALDEI